MEYNAPFVSSIEAEKATAPSERQIEFLMSEVEIEKWEAEALLRKYKGGYLREAIEELRGCTSKLPKKGVFMYLLDRIGEHAKIGKEPRRHVETNEAVKATTAMLYGDKPRGRPQQKKNFKKQLKSLKKMLGGATT